ncbi:class III lanthionine synthetase LanKC [Kitasatospora sp. NPDC057904]|uniref:class III lanthionine synthetase LanKC n=1 Tax=unclassified Kitasatospora TaxID=2633591 RepID=UPI0036DE0ECB
MSDLMRLKDFDRFCLADPDFFELPEQLPDGGTALAPAAGEPPEGWDRVESGWFVRLRPRGLALPEQGWLIHVSPALPHLARTAQAVADWAVRHRVGYDIIRSVACARALGDKHAYRLSSGRPITLYPADEGELRRALGELGGRLEGVPGPSALGALRHRSGPLYARYGSFKTPNGLEILGAAETLRKPDGTLVPNESRPVFTCPDWVALPEPLRQDQEALHAGPAEPFPYQVRRAMQFTNAGGTYLAAEARSGREVELREARPHAGLDRRSEDAVARLTREHATLERLAGLECVPRVIGHHVYGGHHFLAVERIEGRTLAEAAAAALPLTTEERAANEAAQYVSWAMGVLDSLADVLGRLHARGVRLGELNPDKILLGPDGRIVLADFETATDLDDDRAPAVGQAGCTAPAGLRGAEATAYLLHQLQLWLLLPLPGLQPAEFRRSAQTIDELYPLLPDHRTALFTFPGAPPEDDDAGTLLMADPLDWPAIRDSLVDGIHVMASPERPDRLFPATPTSPTSGGGYSLGHGAAGVLYALHHAGAEVPDAYIQWLVAAVERDRTPRPGLYDGLHGAALTLDLLGWRDEALEALERWSARGTGDLDPSLAGGAAGIMLNLLYFAGTTGDDTFREQALCLGEAAAARLLSGEPAVTPGQHPPFGLLHGGAGLALPFLRLYEQGHGSRWLDLAGTALKQDLARCEVLPDGAFALFSGKHHLPYLHGGSIGLAFGLRAFLRHRHDPAVAAALLAIRRTCEALFVRNSGLFRGRAGGIAVLAALGETGDSPAIRTQIHRLAWHARSYRGHLAFPGTHGLRLSADLATGAAGVLLALSSAFEKDGPALPLLDSRPPAPTTLGGR